MARSAGFPIGRVLVSAVAHSPGAGAFTADGNDTHVDNPRRPAHAEFHDAQTMLSAVQLGPLSLWQLWGRRPADRSALHWGALLAALYWLSQAPAVLFPGTATVLAPVLAAGYLLESRRLRGAGR